MKKPVKSKPISQQEEKRSFDIKLIGKKKQNRCYENCKDK